MTKRAYTLLAASAAAGAVSIFFLARLALAPGLAFAFVSVAAGIALNLEVVHQKKIRR